MCYKVSIILIIITTPVIANTLCNKEPRRVPKYHLIEKCHRSKLGIAAKAKYTALASCQKLGIEKKGLALNFSPPDAEYEGNDTLEYTCEVLKCAEADGGLSLVNDTRYDYYSIYAKPIPNVNSTCVPAIGMFQLLEIKLNFTQAMAACRNISGVLPDITSEQRTDTLAQMLASSGVETALVGLKRSNKTGFIGVNGDNLDCTSYRAWAPGHPRRYPNKFDCVVLTKNKMWQSVPCKKQYSVLCELIPSGPYKKGSIFSSRKDPQDNSTLDSNGMLLFYKNNLLNYSFKGLSNN